MSVDFSGKWKQHKEENYEELLKALNVSWMVRKAVGYIPHSTEITQDGDKLKVVASAGPMRQEFNLTIGKDDNEGQNALGEKLKIGVHMDGDKMTTKETVESTGQVLTHTRQIIDGELVHLFETNGVHAKKFYKKVD